MAERLIKLYSYNVHMGKTKSHARTKKGTELWHIHVYAYNPDDRIDVELRNIQPISLPALYPETMKHLDESIAELSPIVNAGFVIYQREEE